MVSSLTARLPGSRRLLPSAPPRRAAPSRRREPVDLGLRDVIDRQPLAEMREQERRVLVDVRLPAWRELREPMQFVRAPEAPECEGAGVARHPELGAPMGECARPLERKASVPVA